MSLGTGDMMTNVTKVGTLENAHALWEYDPREPNNQLLNRSIDVVAGTLNFVIKVCSN